MLLGYLCRLYSNKLLKYKMNKYCVMVIMCLWSICMITAADVKAQQMGSFQELAACMAVVDFQINFYHVFNQLHPDTSDTKNNRPMLSRLLSIKNVIATQVIPLFTPEQTQQLAQIYLITRNQVFMSFVAAETLDNLNMFSAVIQNVDRTCEPLNISIEQ